MSSLAHANWNCQSLLDAALAQTIVAGTELSETDKIWVPDRKAYTAFVETLPPEIKDYENLKTLLEHSIAFKKAVLIFINSLTNDPKMALGDAPSPIILNNLMRVLFNDGNYRVGAIQKIENLLAISLTNAIEASQQAGSVVPLPADWLVKAWTDALWVRLEEGVRSNEETIYNWIMADASPAQTDWVRWDEFWIGARSIDSDQSISPELLKQRMDFLRHEALLIRPGEIVRDSFRRRINDFKLDYLDELGAVYGKMSALKNDGFHDSLETTFSELNSDNKKFAKLLASARFREHFIHFADLYSNAAVSLAKLASDPKLTVKEKIKLHEVYEEYLASYANDLLSLELTFKTGDIRNYRPMIVQIKEANHHLKVIMDTPLIAK